MSSVGVCAVMEDCPPLPLGNTSEGDDDFFSDLGNDEPYIRDQVGRSDRRLVIGVQDGDVVRPPRRINPFSTDIDEEQPVVALISSAISSSNTTTIASGGVAATTAASTTITTTATITNKRMDTNYQSNQRNNSNKNASNSTNPGEEPDSSSNTAEMYNNHNEQPSIDSDHCHIPHSHEPDNTVRNQLIAISIFCGAFMIGEGIGGYFAHSLAIATDVMHLASDLLSFIISLAAIHLAKREPTQRLSWGFFRAEILGALLSVLIIWVVTAVLVYLAIEKIIHKKYDDLQPTDMVITAACGVLFNIIMALILNVEIFKCKVSHGHSHGGDGGGHSHGSHGHSHAMRPSVRRRRVGEEYTPLSQDEDEDDAIDNEVTMSDASPPSQRDKNIVIRAAFVHVIGDLLQSIGVLIAALIIMFVPDARIADPICTFVFSALVMITTYTVVRDSLFILMEGVPKKIPYDELRYQLCQLAGVKTVHSLRVWSLTSNEISASVHIAVENGTDYPAILKQANKIFRHDHLITRTTIQVEPYNEEVMSHCESCTVPKPKQIW